MHNKKNSMLLTAVAALLTANTHATEILHYVDADSGLFGAALSQLGLTSTATTHAGFLSALGSQSWDLVVVDTPGSNVSSANTSALDAYIDAGGLSIISHWNYDANPTLATVFDVSVTSSFSSPRGVYVWDSTHPLFDGVSGVVDYDRDAGDNGDRFATINGATALAGFTPGAESSSAAIVLGNGGRTIANGWLFWDAALTANNINLVANEVDFLLRRPATPVPEPSGIALLGFGLAGIGATRKLRKR
ncbi:MAG: PEP-CTERM sorting domain-containing protein [Gammaproteobacteria bacterium]|nr:PEP-CTERM sorting domain-containing protein [Gammaproteobacteria bacterium]